MFLGCKGHTWAETIEKSNKNYQVWSHGGSTFFKKMPHFGQNPRPGESDPYVAQTKMGGGIGKGGRFGWVGWRGVGDLGSDISGSSRHHSIVAACQTHFSLHFTNTILSFGKIGQQVFNDSSGW